MIKFGNITLNAIIKIMYNIYYAHTYLYAIFPWRRKCCQQTLCIFYYTDVLNKTLQLVSWLSLKNMAGQYERKRKQYSVGVFTFIFPCRKDTLAK